MRCCILNNPASRLIERLLDHNLTVRILPDMGLAIKNQEVLEFTLWTINRITK